MSELDKVFLKFIGTNLEKHVMEKKENEKKTMFAEFPDLALGKSGFAKCPDLTLGIPGFAECQIGGTRQTLFFFSFSFLLFLLLHNVFF